MVGIIVIVTFFATVMEINVGVLFDVIVLT